MMLYYWGGMVQKGADTFWEVYDPNDDCRSPYNSHLVNSYCHAWSCTPVYFINKYLEIFQKYEALTVSHLPTAIALFRKKERLLL